MAKACAARSNLDARNASLLCVFLLFACTAARPQTAPANAAASPTDSELAQRGTTLVANQHKNDEALDHYERIEHEVDTAGGPNTKTILDKKIRIVPNGAGTTKLLLEQGGQTVAPDDYHRELQTWLSVLQFMANPNDDRMKAATAKYTKRKQARTELVDAMLTAFKRKWVGREASNGRDCDVIQLEPDPNFHPRSILEEALTHAGAKIWVDHSANQLVRAEARITSDIYVGGGVLGKLNKGGTFVIEQAEVSPGVWLPTRYQFDFSGREFLFWREKHQMIEAADYRYIGSAKEALAIAQSELSSGKPAAGDP